VVKHFPKSDYVLCERPQSVLTQDEHGDPKGVRENYYIKYTNPNRENNIET